MLNEWIFCCFVWFVRRSRRLGFASEPCCVSARWHVVPMSKWGRFCRACSTICRKIVRCWLQRSILIDYLNQSYWFLPAGSHGGVCSAPRGRSSGSLVAEDGCFDVVWTWWWSSELRLHDSLSADQRFAHHQWHWHCVRISVDINIAFMSLLVEIFQWFWWGSKNITEKFQRNFGRDCRFSEVNRMRSQVEIFSIRSDRAQIVLPLAKVVPLSFSFNWIWSLPGLMEAYNQQLGRFLGPYTSDLSEVMELSSPSS